MHFSKCKLLNSATYTLPLMESDLFRIGNGRNRAQSKDVAARASPRGPAAGHVRAKLQNLLPSPGAGDSGSNSCSPLLLPRRLLCPQLEQLWLCSVSRPAASRTAPAAAPVQEDGACGRSPSFVYPGRRFVGRVSVFCVSTRS